MILGHRTKNDSKRTVVYKVTIPDDPDGIDTYEMEKLEVESAIKRYQNFNARARAQIPITKDW
jgi:hypothetical protein